jgi:uncharacterized membrane protein
MKSLSNYKVDWKDQEKAPYVLLFLMMLVYFLFFSMLSINKHNRFGTSGFDLGIHDQANWLLSQGETAFITVRGLHIFADHASYIHILSSRIFWLWDDVRALLILQTFAFAISAVPLYFLAGCALCIVCILLCNKEKVLTLFFIRFSYAYYKGRILFDGITPRNLRCDKT